MKNNSAHILVIDNNQTDLMMIAEILSTPGYQVRAVNDALAAWECLLQLGQEIDLIILNCMMPVMDGLTLLKRFKSEERFRDIPVVMYASRLQTDNMIQMIDAGASFCLPKPVEKKILLSVVTSSLQAQKQVKETVTKAERQVKELYQKLKQVILDKQQLEFDLYTMQIYFDFFMRSQERKERCDLTELLLETVKLFRFDSAGETRKKQFLRCTVYLGDGKEMCVSDRGTSSKTDEAILQKTVDSGEIISHGTYSAIPSQSGKYAILIRNTPKEQREALDAQNIVSLLLQRFEERLDHLEQ